MSLNIVGGIYSGITAIRNFIQFNIAAGAPSYAEGRVYWDATDHTIAVMPDVNGPVLQVGQENWVRVVNKTGSLIADGKVVYVSGGSSGRPKITLAKADAESTSEGVIGVVTYDIADNAEGFVTTQGVVRDFNTSGFTAGDALWLSAATAGAITNTKPNAPDHAVFIGYALNSLTAVNGGKILVHVDRGAEISELHDVFIDTLADKNFLQYNIATLRWENVASLTVAGSDAGSVSAGNVAIGGGVVRAAPSNAVSAEVFRYLATGLNNSAYVDFLFGKDAANDRCGIVRFQNGTGASDSYLGFMVYGDTPTLMLPKGKGITVAGSDPGSVSAGQVAIGGGVLRTAGDMVTSGAFDLGDPATNGSWRLALSGNNLVIQRRETGYWVTKSTVEA